MEIYFENWIKEQDVSEDAKILFNESIMCYRVGAFRAAYIMSYLGFFKTIKDRLLRSEIPELMKDEEGVWNNLVNRLKDDRKWEEAVIQAIQMKKKIDESEEVQSKVFLITNDIIEEIPFWRRKRNECAHAKDTIIGHSHVEMFWLFLRSNLSKFIVNGGKQALLEKIKKHFDPTYTKPNSDFTYLIKEIPLVVKKDELKELLKDIYNDYVNLSLFGRKKQETEFWRAIAYSENRDIVESFVEFITSDKDVFTQFVETFPDRLTLCLGKEELIRVFWRELLFKDIGNFNHVFWELAITLLTSGVIPEEERQTFVRKLSRQLKNGAYPDEDQARVLRKHDFFKIIKDTLFESGDLNKVYTGYQFANSNGKKIVYYLENNPLDAKVVSELNILFKSYMFGDLYSRMESFMERSPRFIYEFRAIAEEEGMELAEFFKEKGGSDEGETSEQ
ncbi:hypothetical protein [Robertmurraya andreesenii]|uniref:Uncharacterized protein n=1 Tax=Anoxybacillus andreesenii TaxID=1325932 RepID=A0ABT9UZJ8_9BACL|nr:hypothetical protein [Robertmurraya andreesenii]MDQ0154120.1 hypothetical protein [Robertmurraya andreesenii]